MLGYSLRGVARTAAGSNACRLKRGPTLKVSRRSKFFALPSSDFSVCTSSNLPPRVTSTRRSTVRAGVLETCL